MQGSFAVPAGNPAGPPSSQPTSSTASVFADKPASMKTNKQDDIRNPVQAHKRLDRGSGRERQLLDGRRRGPLERRGALALTDDAQEPVAPTTAVRLEGNERPVRGAHARARLVEGPAPRRVSSGAHAQSMAVLDRQRDFDDL